MGVSAGKPKLCPSFPLSFLAGHHIGDAPGFDAVSCQIAAEHAAAVNGDVAIADIDKGRFIVGDQRCGRVPGDEKNAVTWEIAPGVIHPLP